MTNQELQIDFTTKFNRLSGSSSLGFSLEEIDWYLNEDLYEKINSCLDNKRNKLQEDYSDTRRQLFDIETLFTELSLPVNKKSEEIGMVILPPNFLHLVNAKAAVNKSCKPKDKVITNRTIRYFSIEFGCEVNL